MFAKTGWGRLAGASLLLVLFAAVLRADDAAAVAAIEKLLDVGWATTPQARIAADLQFTEVSQAAGTDPRGLAAAWLVLMQQRRYDDALKRLDEYLAKEPGDLQALRAKAWSQTILKNYAAALVTAERLSQQMAAAAPMTDEARVEHNELIGFLGRLFGYLGGPVAPAVNQEQRKAAERKIVSRIDESRQSLFEDAYNGVLTRFIAMTDESADAKDKAVAAAEAAKTETLAAVEADRNEAAARAAELEASRKKLQSEFRDELDQIAKEDRPLVGQLAQLEARVRVLQRDLLAYQADIDRLSRLAANEEDPARRQQFLFEADRLAIFASRLDGDLIAASRLARGVQAQRQALAARQAQAQASAATQTQRLDRELADIARREKRNEGVEKRAARATVGPTGKVRALSAQATALSTYDQFPLESVKARLQESLR